MMNTSALVFLDNFSILLGTFPEKQALEFAIKESHFSIRKKLNKSLLLLENGYTLDECLNSTKLFPEFFIESLRSSIVSGNTKEVIDKFVSKFKEDNKLEATIKVILLIPKIQILACFIILCYSSQKILPSYLFLIKGQEIPWQTMLLSSLGTFLSKYYSNLLVVATIVFAFWIFYKQTKLHHILKDAMTAILFRRFYKVRIMERFSYMLGLLLESGIDLEKALKLSDAFVDAPYFNKHYKKMIEMIQNGNSLSHSVSNLFDSKYIALIDLGEKTEGLIGSLKKCNEISLEYRKKEEEKIIAIVQNACPMIIAAMIIFIILGVGMPIMSYAVYL